MTTYVIFLIFTCAILQVTPHASAQTMITGAQIRNPFTPVDVLPSTCTPFSIYFLKDTQVPYICTATDTLTPLSNPSQNAGAGLPSMTGLPGYLYSDGLTVSWGNITTGGSGVLDCVSMPGQCDIDTAVLPALQSANHFAGLNNFDHLLIPLDTIAPGDNQLPDPTTVDGQMFWVTDGASACDTTVGGGATRVLVHSDGVQYVAPNCVASHDSDPSEGSDGGGTNTTASVASSFATDGGIYAPYGLVGAGAGGFQTGPVYYAVTIPAGGITVKSIDIPSPGASAPGESVAAAWYDSTCTKVAGSDSGVVGASVYNYHYDFPFATPLTLAPGTYYVALSISGAALTSVLQVSSDPYTAYTLGISSNPPVFTGSNPMVWSEDLVPTFPSTCGTKSGVLSNAYGMPLFIIRS